MKDQYLNFTICWILIGEQTKVNILITLFRLKIIKSKQTIILEN